MKFKTFFLLIVMLLSFSPFSADLFAQKKESKKQRLAREAREAEERRKAALNDLNLSATDVHTDLEGYLTLRFSDALTGNPVKDASVNIDGIGTYKTDAEGKVLFPNQHDGKAWDDGYYKTTFSKSGYITTDFKTRILFGSIFHNRMSVSPELNIKFLRAVVDWDKSPSDLDAHLKKSSDYHISYRHTRVAQDGSAQLDRDDTNGYGPETITVKELDKGSEYVFFIHNYSDRSKPGSKGLSNSRGVVRVYGDGKLQETIQVPERSSGRVWAVFKIQNGQVQIINKVVDDINTLN